MVQFHSNYPLSPSDYRKQQSNIGRYIIYRKSDEIKENPLANTLPPSARQLWLLRLFSPSIARSQLT
jgi:hypothetical protein